MSLFLFSYINLGDSMNNVLFAFICSTLAGLSTLLGGIIIFFNKKENQKIIATALAFAAGVMITVSITDLIPESFHLLSEYFYVFPTFIILAIFVVIGIIFSMLIDYYLPEQQEGKLYRIGIVSMLAIIAHNIPEGIATFLSTTSNTNLGITLSLAIALHNIPEGISISVPIYYATKSRGRALKYTFISGISELFGAIIAFIFLKDIMNNFIMGYLLASIAGIMMHIASYELLPTSLRYKYKKITLIFFILGSIIMIINHML